VTVDVALLQLLSLPILAAFLLLFLPRIFKPFKGFTLTLAGTDNDPVTLSTARHIRVAGYMLMQLFLMGIVVTALQMPLNIFFGLFRLNMSTPVSLGCVIFLTGPYAMKMFVGHTFQDFRVDVKRPE